MVQSSDPEAPPEPQILLDADLESLHTRRRQARRKQLKIVALLAALVVLGVVADQTLRRTFLAVRTPKVRFSSVAVQNSTTTGGGGFRIRLEAQVTVKNTNFGRFKYYYSGYGNLTAGVYYQGTKVGEGVIADGAVGARKTKKFGVTLDLSSGDVNSGSLVLSTKAKFTGNVQVIGIVRKNRDPELSCTMTVKLESKTVQDLVCL